MVDEPPAAAPEAPPAEAAPARPPRWGAGAALGLTLAVLAAWGLVQALVFVVFHAGVQAAGSVAPAEGSFGVPHLGLALSLTTLASCPVGVALTLLFVRLRPGAGVRDQLGLRRPSLRQTLVWGLALALFLGGYDLLARLLDRPVNPPSMVEAYRTCVVPVLFWLAVGVAAPLFEEVLFRGFLLPSLACSRIGRPGAVVVSALLFAVLHVQYDLFDVGAVAALGMLFAVARLQSGSTVLTFGMHVLTNLLALAQIAAVVEPV